MESVIHLDDRGEGKATIFLRGRLWRDFKRVPKEGNPDAAAEWFDATDDRFEAVDEKTQTLLERAYRHPEMMEPVCRYSRLNAEDTADKAKASLLEDLEDKAIQWIKRGRQANLELGRLFIQIRELVDHGEWEPYFESTFAPHGIALRTAQEYMRMAREADKISKNAESALFLPATDPGAQAINDANERAAAAVEEAAEEQSADRSTLEHAGKTDRPRKKRIRPDGIYRLLLYMTGDEKDATDELVASPNWPAAEKEIRTFLRQLRVKYVKEETRRFPRLPLGETLETAPIIFRDGTLTKTGRFLAQVDRSNHLGSAPGTV